MAPRGRLGHSDKPHIVCDVEVLRVPAVEQVLGKVTLVNVANATPKGFGAGGRAQERLHGGVDA